MTFSPEWLAGSPNLDTSNWMYLCVSPGSLPVLMIRSYLYLTFFNVLWVILPVYSLYEAYASLTAATPVEAAKKKQ
jgi:hypothetical protein